MIKITNLPLIRHHQSLPWVKRYQLCLCVFCLGWMLLLFLPFFSGWESPCNTPATQILPDSLVCLLTQGIPILLPSSNLMCFWFILHPSLLPLSPVSQSVQNGWWPYEINCCNVDCWNVASQLRWEEGEQVGAKRNSGVGRRVESQCSVVTENIRLRLGETWVLMLTQSTVKLTWVSLGQSLTLGLTHLAGLLWGWKQEGKELHKPPWAGWRKDGVKSNK